MIGLYGGSFDPVHFAHLETALAVKKELQLKKCYLLPCAQPVHKKNLYFSSKQRLAMLKLAITTYKDLEIDDSEIKKGGKSYTIDTIKKFKANNPNTTLCLIIGIDNFIGLKTWKNWQYFDKFVHLIILQRPNYKNDNDNDNNFTQTYDKDLLKKQKNGLLYFASAPLINISATNIRYKITANENLEKDLPITVINYIKNIK